MIRISDISNAQPAALVRPAQPGNPGSDGTANGPSVERLAPDTVELSKFGLFLSREVTPSSFRAARLASVKSEIEAGTYETPERLEMTVERLLEILR